MKVIGFWLAATVLCAAQPSAAAPRQQVSSAHVRAELGFLAGDALRGPG
jgi:hypothetical protein